MAIFRGIQGLLLLAIVAVSVSAVFAAEMGGEPGVVYKITGDRKNEGLGQGLSPVGDVDEDGVIDFAVSATVRRNPGYVRIYSGASGAVIRTIESSLNRELGGYLERIDDRNGDGVRELLTPYGDGWLVFSPSTGEFLDEFSFMDGVFWVFATQTDFDGDGLDEILLVDRLYPKDGPDGRFPDFGRVALYSIAQEAILWDRTGDHVDSLFGTAIAVVQDLTGDGVSDVLAGDNGPLLENKAPRVLLLDGQSGEPVRVVIEFIPGFDPYLVGLTDLGDLDGDGVAEIATSSDYSEETWWKRGRGRCVIYNGRTFDILRVHEGLERENPSVGFSGDQLGFRIGPVGDFDGDGVSDYGLATSRAAGLFDPQTRFYVHSGKTGKILVGYETPTQSFFDRYTPLGDVDLDGSPEFLVAKTTLPREGALRWAGEVRVLRYDPALPTFLRGDGNGDGVVDFSDVVVVLRYLFAGHETVGCLQAIDVSGNQEINVADANRVVGYVFFGAVSPAAPFPDCARYGGILTDPLSCERSTCTP